MLCILFVKSDLMADRHEITLFQTWNANLQRNHYLHWQLKLKVPDRSLQPWWDIMYYTSHATLGLGDDSHRILCIEWRCDHFVPSFRSLSISPFSLYIATNFFA
jgi:hypothetical protein